MSFLVSHPKQKAKGRGSQQAAVDAALAAIAAPFFPPGSNITSSALDALAAGTAPAPGPKRFDRWPQLSDHVYLVVTNGDMSLDFRVPSPECQLIAALLGAASQLPTKLFTDAVDREVTPISWGMPCGPELLPPRGPLPTWAAPEGKAYSLDCLSKDSSWRQRLTWHGEAKELHQWVPKTIAWLKLARKWGAVGNLSVFIS